MTTEYDVVVVGAGIFGACTAYHCQKLGLRTLLLEQFDLYHSSGSSHGKSRITRYAHTETEYVPLVADAYKQIAELEAKRNEKLWKKTGLLWVSNGNEIEKISNNLKEHNIEHEVIQGNEIGKRYKAFHFTDEWNGLIDPMGGVIFADKWLKTFIEEFKELGGVVLPQTIVLSHDVLEDGSIVVKTKSQDFKCKKLIFTVGSWIKKFLKNVEFEITPISVTVCYWKTKKEIDTHIVNYDNYPVTIAQEMNLKVFHYSLPDIDHPGMLKFCYHKGSPITDEFGHPEERAEELISHPAKFIQNYMPLVDGEHPAKVEFCKYTNSPDDHYIIGRIPNQNDNVLFGGCGSGSGFKVAPGIGRALAEIAAGKPTTVDVSFFSAARFEKNEN